jgi:hypothetical protein
MLLQLTLVIRRLYEKRRHLFAMMQVETCKLNKEFGKVKGVGSVARDAVIRAERMVAPGSE